MSLLWPLSASKEDDGIGTEFVNDLTACAARRTGHALIVYYGDSTNLNLWTKLRHSRENRRALGAIGHSVGRVLHIATRKDFAIRKQDGGPNPELRVGRVRILHDFLRTPEQSR